MSKSYEKPDADTELGSTALFAHWLRSEMAREKRKISKGCRECCPHQTKYRILEQCLQMLKEFSSHPKLDTEDKYAISTVDAMDYVEGMLGKQDCFSDRVSIALYLEILRLRANAQSD